MEELAPPEHDAPVRLTQDEAQDLVLRTVATQAESLLRTAYRHSLCADDAHDAYQRSMEIFMRRAPTLDPQSADRWLHVVVKHEAIEVRRGRSELVATEDIDFDRHAAHDVSSPEERALSIDRATRAAEALRRLKPQELRAMWLKALGHSYAEIGQATGYSATKVNRCLVEGRKSFLERFEGIETGEECARWGAVLSAMVDGEATAAQLTDIRPHLRNCPSCRATLRGLHRSERSLAAVLPVGLAGAGVKFASLIERLVPGAGADAAAGGAAVAGGAGFLGVGGAKLAGLVAAGAAATAGGGIVAMHEQDKGPSPPKPAVVRSGVAPVRTATVAAVTKTPAAGAAGGAARARPASAAAKPRRARATRRLVARRDTATGRVEFTPRGSEPAAAAPPPAVIAQRPAQGAAPRPVSTPASAAGGSDSTRGEFAPQP
jgi:RNA polymerase sigma factor (sigma-70 family)